MEQTLGKRIAANRKRLGLTQDQLAEKLGVTAQAVSKWENDQSCPDISVLPKLADIFGISTDTLLGREQEPPVHEAEIIDTATEDSGDTGCSHGGSWVFHPDSGKKDGIGLAVTVLTVGILYLLSRIFLWDLSFWDILWPTALLIFGLFGLLPKFSFFRLGCALLGGYFLVSKLLPLPMKLDGGIVFAVIVLLFGFSLLIDALRKSRRAGSYTVYTGTDSGHQHGKTTNNYETEGDSFHYNASFGENHQLVSMAYLCQGSIATSFGEYTVDLSGVEEAAPDCTIEANCSFGELTLLVPRRFTVKPFSSTSFASFNIEGQPDDTPAAHIQLQLRVSFGQIKLIYI